MGIWWYWTKPALFTTSVSELHCGIWAVCFWDQSLLMSSSLCMPQKTFLLSCFRFDEKENVSNCIQLKTSVIKGIKNQLLEQFPDIESWLNHIMPKKDPVKIVKWYDLSFFFFSVSQYSRVSSPVYISTALPTAMNTLKSWQWMENCSSSDREKDHSTQLSDCCINVRSSDASCDGCFWMMSAWHDVSFSLCRSFHSSTPASRQRGH